MAIKLTREISDGSLPVPVAGVVHWLDDTVRNCCIVTIPFRGDPPSRLCYLSPCGYTMRPVVEMSSYEEWPK